MTDFNSITSVLTTAMPPTSEAEAEALARAHWGVPGTARRLTGERDHNFHLHADDGRDFVLKITNPAEDRSVTDFQTRALLHVEAMNPRLPVQRVLRTPHGEASIELDGDGAGTRVVRLLSYLHGEPLHKVVRTPAQRSHLGRTLAELGLALRDFSHPAADHELLWDMKHASRIRELLGHVDDKRRRDLAERFLDQFEAHALPVLPTLRAQVIHNDLNAHNVLVDPDDHDRVTGILDFGDMVHAPLIDDLAVACAYQLSDHAQPLDSAAEFAAAYHSAVPLTGAEVEILFDLIATRLVMSATITGWRAAQYPENREYILRNNPLSWDGLERLARLERADARDYLRRACAMEAIAMSTTNAFEAGRVALSEREQAMIARRQKLLGPAYRLFYQHPVASRPRRGRVALRRRRRPLSRRLQQRAERRPLPSACRRRRSPAGGAAQHAHALPARQRRSITPSDCSRTFRASSAT